MSTLYPVVCFALLIFSLIPCLSVLNVIKGMYKIRIIAYIYFPLVIEYCITSGLTDLLR